MKYLVDDARVLRGVRRKKKSRAFKRVLAAAACLLIAAAVTTAAIPSARAAVGEWFMRHFTARDYLGEESGARTPEPALDAVIKKIDAGGQEIRITDVYDSDEARSLAEGFGMRLDEIAYTGNEIYITGWFTGTSGKFLLDPRTGGDTWSGSDELVDGDMMLTLPDGQILYGVLNAVFTEEMDALVDEAFGGNHRHPMETVYDDAGNFVTSNAKADELWYAWLENNEVRFTFETRRIPDDAPLSGLVDARLSFYRYYWDAQREEIVILFNADLGNVRIDADAYRSVSSTKKVDRSVTLSGTHRMFISEWEYQGEEAYINNYVRDLDMSGLRVTAESVSFTPTGPEIALRLDLPKSWTRVERKAAASGGDNEGLGFVILLDGEQAQIPFSHIAHSAYTSYEEEQADPLYTVPRVYSESFLSPSEWEAVKTVTFIPCLNWPGEMYVEEIDSEKLVQARTRMEPGVTVREHVNYESAQRDDWQRNRLDEYAITIHLDDYR